jgi:hypothetical protein
LGKSKWGVRPERQRSVENECRSAIGEVQTHAAN